MRPRFLLAPPIVFLVLLAAATPVRAVIKLELTLAKIFETSKTVLVGTVGEVQADARLVAVRAVQAAKGVSPGPELRIVLAAPAELIKQVTPGAPVVVCVGQAKGSGLAVVHLADTWLLAKGIPGSEGQLWRVEQLHDAAKPSFPGRTATLVRLIDELKAGRNPIVDKFERKLFPAGLQQRAKLNVSQPTWLLAADVDGDKQPDLIVGTASGVRLLLANGRGYDDATEAWGLAPAAGGYHAAGDVDGDGKIDLLLDQTVWQSDGRRFMAAKEQVALPAKGQPLGAALIDVTGDGKLDAVYLSTEGELRVSVNRGSGDSRWQAAPAKTLPKLPASPTLAAFGDWGDNGKPHVLVIGESGVHRYPLDQEHAEPADLERLSGVNIAKNARYRAGLKNVRPAVIDADRNGQPDLLAVCDTGGLLLVNRGFGAFLLDEDAAGPFGVRPDYRPPLSLSSATPWTAADLHGDGCDDLLILAADGTLYEAANGGRGG
jgi:hypothetical protein